MIQTVEGYCHTDLSPGGAQEPPVADGRRQAESESESIMVPGLLSAYPGAVGSNHLEEGVWDQGLRSVFPLQASV